MRRLLLIGVQRVRCIGWRGNEQCGTLCPSTCAANCPQYFTAAPRADDGLPLPQAPEGWSPYEQAETPGEYWAWRPPNYLPYSPPGVPSFTGQPSASWTATPTEPQQPENYLAPCYPGQNYCVSPSTVSEGGAGVEPSFPTFPPCTPANYCYPDSGIGEATPEPEPECPTAPDGHPMRWYDYLGCQDIYWKEHYCASARTCNDCTYRAGCIWNGGACVPCNAPMCSYSCRRPAPAAPPGGWGAQQPQPAQQTAAAPAPVTVRQNQIPGPTPQLPSEVPTPALGQPTPAPAASPIAPQASATPTQPIPSPPLQCNSFTSCESCVKAPKNAEGKSQCGWSVFVGACLGSDEWKALNASELKAGWIDEKKNCPSKKEKEKEKQAYCFEYADCFSCAGEAGVKRKCQWSLKEEACVPYSPLSEFKTKNSPNADNVILPSFCEESDCSKYSDCAACQKNAACIWNFDDKKCVNFKGHNAGETLKLYANNCGGEAKATTSPTPTPTPVFCPKDCECDAKARVKKCGGAAVNDSGFVHTDRAAANAAAAASIEQLNEIIFSQSAAGDAEFAVKGSRGGTILFFIPVSIDVAATVNAHTGAVEKIEQPWWAFLVS
ncbi:MAG: hypothetical protein QW343_00755 [Candidatus Norongarragalinales archaeon]